MSLLKAKNSENMKNAMKSGDKDTVTYSRNLHAAIRKKEIDDRKDLEDADVIRLAGQMAKQREDSIAQFKAGGRDDLVTKEEAELQYLQGFLPTQMNEAELMALINQAVLEAQATQMKDLGKVMKILQPQVQGKADGKWVNQILREKLGG